MLYISVLHGHVDYMVYVPDINELSGQNKTAVVKFFIKKCEDCSLDCDSLY